MKKLTLELEQLDVQSFTTADEAPGRGTVHAEQQQCTCYTCTCPACYTCAQTCPNTCPVTCWHTCDNDTCGSCGRSCWETCDNTCATGFCVCVQEG